MKALFSTIFIVAALLTPVAPLLAQDRSQPDLRITDIDITEFPLIAVYLYAQNLEAETEALPIVLAEDNLERPIQSNQQEEVGAQVAFAIDASSNIRSPGVSGQLRLEEVRNAVNDFVGLGMLSAEKDWLSAHATADAADEYRVIAPWQQDHQAVANALIQDEPSNALQVTSLFGLIDFTLTQIANSPAPSRLQRSMVIFSDGADIVSNVEVDDIVRRAEQLNVQLHTVMLGGGGRDSRRNLGRLAEVTGGAFVEFTELASMQPVWQKIESQRTQQRLTYRLTQAQPRALSVSAQLPDGRLVGDELDFPVVGARPAELTIKTAADLNQIVRRGNAANTPLADLQPNTVQIAVQALWPDEHPRAFRRVEYSLDSDTHVQETAPLELYEFPIAGLDVGRYTIRVTALDELGLTSSAAPVTLEILIERLPAMEQAAAEAADDSARQDDASSATLDAGPAAQVEPVRQERAPATPTASEPTPEVTAEPTPADAPSAADVLPTANGSAASQSTVLFGQTLPSQLRVAGYTIPITPFTLLGAGALLLLLLLALTLIFTPRKPKDHFALSGADVGAFTFKTPPSTSPGAATYGSEPYQDIGFSDDQLATVPSVAPFDFEDDATAPVRMVNFAAAHLVYVDGGGHLPEKLPLEQNREHRIGRSSQICDLIIDDKRVSRRHATIIGREESFYLQDDGSAGGTYLNERRLGVTDAPVLRDGDVINFNEVAYRFEVRKPAGRQESATEALG